MCITRINGFLRSPNKAFEKEKNTKLDEAFKHMAVLAAVYAVLSGVTSLLFNPAAWQLGILFLVLTYGFLLIFIPLWGLIVHAFAYLFGARSGIHQTLKSVFYGSTPMLLLGWIPIPYIIVIFIVWTIVLNIIGLKSLHNMATGRAALAVIVPEIIALAIIALIFVLFSEFVPPGALLI